MTADRFVINHIISVNNNVKLFKSKQLRHCLSSEMIEYNVVSPIKSHFLSNPDKQDNINLMSV